MDLASIKPSAIEHDVKHPLTGKGTGLILTIACRHDSRVKANIREANDWAVAIGEKMTDSQKDEYDDRLAAAHIIDFRFEGDAEWKNLGTPDYDSEIAVDIAGTPFIKEQLLTKTRNTGNFYKA